MFSSNIALFHVVCALVALLSGALVLLINKGTAKHKMVGYAYFSSMLLMNVSALFTQSLYTFGPFYWMALGSLATVCAGLAVPVFFRKNKNWLRLHYDFMLWSYVGLIAALFSEIIVRVPAISNVVGGGLLFWLLVGFASIGTFTIGGRLISSKRKMFV
ncbi:DUF2306 domain-containing protein [Marinicellulosiphila megalodicopiae]|uniref:DUF2306 domain-containing protein n=1 Tax=Marinicellulosiphila megalodicopiae TaxID=2724896 RepID=UPI003BB043FD